MESLGQLSLREAASAIREFGFNERAARLEAAAMDNPDAILADGYAEEPYEYTGVALGFIPNDYDESDAISSARTIAADDALKNQALNIKLDGFITAKYPDSGTIEVLLECTARHHWSDNRTEESVTFTRKFPVRAKGSAAGITGLPLFVGVQVPAGGVGLEFKLVYVKNEDARRGLAFLESAPMKAGLALVGAANPAVGQVTQFAEGVVKYVSERNDGRVIHSGYVGLDFGGRTGARLKVGTYIVAQTPKQDINWSSWKYTTSGIVNDLAESFPFNYMLLRVEEHALDESNNQSAEKTKPGDGV